MLDGEPETQGIVVFALAREQVPHPGRGRGCWSRKLRELIFRKRETEESSSAGVCLARAAKANSCSPFTHPIMYAYDMNAIAFCKTSSYAVGDLFERLLGSSMLRSRDQRGCREGRERGTFFASILGDLS